VLAADKKQQGAKEQKRAGALFATIDLLYWQLRRCDLDYSVSSLPGAMVISGGEIHELEHPSDAGFRTMLGVELATGWQIGFGYTMFDSSTTGSAQDGAGTLYANRSHPDMNRRAGVADADSSFDLRILDLEVRNTLMLGDRADLSLFGGFRWVDIGQRFHVFYEEIEFPIGGAVTALLDTKACGLRIGADGKWAMTENLYLVGTGETSILFGDNRLSLEETEGTTTIVDVADSYEQVLPVIGTRAGAGYQKGPLQIEMGYEMQAWFDLGDRMGFLDDQHLSVFSHSNHNVLLDRYYLRLPATGSVLQALPSRHTGDRVRLPLASACVPARNTVTISGAPGSVLGGAVSNDPVAVVVRHPNGCFLTGRLQRCNSSHRPPCRSRGASLELDQRRPVGCSETF
jgi:hypothetical protein